MTVIPVGRVDLDELEGALTRVSKTIHRPVELREVAPLPRATEDTARGQHRAEAFLTGLRTAATTLGVRKLVGGTVARPGVPTPSPDATVFVTDVDLFAPNTEGVFAHLEPPSRCGVVSVRRLREAFYRRKADPERQRSRLVKEILRAVGRLRGLPDCADPACVLSATQALPDIDRKREKFCGACWRRLTTGVVRM